MHNYKLKLKKHSITSKFFFIRRSNLELTRKCVIVIPKKNGDHTIAMQNL